MIAEKFARFQTETIDFEISVREASKDFLKKVPNGF